MAGKKIALVPTMGALHQGHLSLIRIAADNADIVIVSIFVNPLQFGPGEDYESYPRPLEEDIRLVEREGVSVLFTPEAGTLFPAGNQTRVDVADLAHRLCGRKRPGHFCGVATIVARLFNITRPDVAIFGEKDFQQLTLLRQMTRDLNFPIEIIGGPIIREADGLAMSSRNKYLNPAERARATCLFRALEYARNLVENGMTDTRQLIEKTAVFFDHAETRAQTTDPAAIVDYLEIIDSTTLDRQPTVTPESRLMLAVRIGSTRLIDNGLLAP